MKVIKPLRLSLITRPFEHQRQCRLGVAAMAAVSLTEQTAPLQEPDFWKVASEAFGEAPLLDVGIPKSRAEFLMIGDACAPAGQTVTQMPVLARVGQLEKKAYVFGDRHWQHGLPTQPTPFERMPLDWEHAYGGPAFPNNPKGKGHKADADDPAHEWPLPNIECPKRLMTSPRTAAPPHCFAPIDMFWPQRVKYRGTYDKHYLKRDFPGFAHDVNWRFFDIGSEDQQQETFFRGDEDIQIESMHPEHPHLVSRLPRMKVRAFAAYDETSAPLQEIPMHLTTVWLLPNQLHAIVIFHGGINVQEDDARDVALLMTSIERLDQERDFAHYERTRDTRLDRKEAGLLALSDADLLPEEWQLDLAPKLDEVERSPISKRIQARIAHEKKKAKERKDAALAEVHQARQSADSKLAADPLFQEMNAVLNAYVPDEEDSSTVAPLPLSTVHPDTGEPLPTLPSNDALQAQADEAQRIQRVFEDNTKSLSDTSGLPSTEVDLSLPLGELVPRLREMKAQLQAYAKEKKEQAKALSAKIKDQRANDALPTTRGDTDQEETWGPPRFDAHALFLTLQEQVAQLDKEVQHIDLDTARKQLDAAAADTTVDAAQIAKSREALDQQMQRVHNTPSLVAIRSGEMLKSLKEKQEKLHNAYRKTAYYQSPVPPLDDEVARQRGAALLDAIAAGQRVHGQDFTGADLRNANLQGANLKGVFLESANLTGADLTDAHCESAVFTRAKLRGANLTGTCFKEANLGATNLSRTHAERPPTFEKAVLNETDFSHANLGAVNFTHSALQDVLFEAANFAGAKAEGLTILKGSIKHGDFTGSSFVRCTFIEVDATHADFKNATLTKSTFLQSVGNDIDFSGATMHGFRLVQSKAFHRANFTQSVLSSANLRGVSLQGAIFDSATLTKADLSEANLQGAWIRGVRARKSRWSRTDLTGANLRGSDFMHADFSKALIFSASFEKSSLFGADFSRVQADRSTNLHHADQTRVRIEPRRNP